MMIELHKGGDAVLWRHAATDYSTRDAPGFPDEESDPGGDASIQRGSESGL